MNSFEGCFYLTSMNTHNFAFGDPSFGASYPSRSLSRRSFLSLLDFVGNRIPTTLSSSVGLNLPSRTKPLMNWISCRRKWNCTVLKGNNKTEDRQRITHLLLSEFNSSDLLLSSKFFQSLMNFFLHLRTGENRKGLKLEQLIHVNYIGNCSPKIQQNSQHSDLVQSSPIMSGVLHSILQ